MTEYSWGLGIEHEVVPLYHDRVLRRISSTDRRLYPTAEAVNLTKIDRKLQSGIIEPSHFHATGVVPLYPMEIEGDHAGRPCVELITRYWKKRTLGQYVDDLLQTRRLLLGDLQKLVGEREIRWPEHGADLLLSSRDPRRVDPPTYLGSYHVNYTVPHPVGLSSKQLLLRNTKAAMALQWIEPVLMACLACPSPLSVLDHQRFSQMSVRHASEPLAIALARDLLKHGFPDNRHSNWDTRPSKKNEPMRPAEAAATRIPGSFNPLNPKEVKAAVTTLKRGLSKHVSEFPQWLRIILKKSEHSPLALKHFARNHMAQMQDGLVGPTLGTDLRRDTGHGSRFGFEFRLLDYFPPEAGLLDVLRLMVYATDASAAWQPTLARFDAMTCEDVHKQYILCILEGYNATALPGYVKALERVFGVSLTGKCCQHVMHSLASALFEKFGRGRGRYSRHMDRDIDGKLYTSAPRVPEINRNSWDTFLERRFPSAAKQIAKHKSPVESSDVLRFLGTVHPTSDERAAVDEDIDELRMYQRGKQSPSRLYT